MTSRFVPVALSVFVFLPALACGGTTSFSSDSDTVAAGSADTAPFSWPVPAGWSEETDAFPLFWAPDLDLAGTLVVRFAPGFDDPTADTYFSYSFAWILDHSPGFGADRLATDVTTYYAGLARTFDAAHFDASAHHAEFRVIEPGGLLLGVVNTVDPFNGSAPLTLHVDAIASRCGEHEVLRFTVSPHPRGDATWKTIAAQGATFQCSSSTR